MCTKFSFGILKHHIQIIAIPDTVQRTGRKEATTTNLRNNKLMQTDAVQKVESNTLPFIGHKKVPDIIRYNNHVKSLFPPTVRLVYSNNNAVKSLLRKPIKKSMIISFVHYYIYIYTYFFCCPTSSNFFVLYCTRMFLLGPFQYIC